MSKSTRTVTFACDSTTEADLIRNAVNRYRHVIAERGDDPRNYAPANAEGAGFGWDAVRQTAREMSNGSVTHMSRRMAESIRTALESKGAATSDADARRMVVALVFRLNAAIHPVGGE